MGNIQWSNIKKTIKIYCKNAFAEQSISISEMEIDKAIDIFYNLLNKQSLEIFLFFEIKMLYQLRLQIHFLQYTLQLYML